MPESKYSKGLEGMRFNRTVIRAFAYRRLSTKTYVYYWICLCDCGTWHVSDARSMFRGMIQSCGCFGKEKLNLRTIHGATKRGGLCTREYTSWKKLRGRIDNPNNEWFHRYGGRGICYCEGFTNFGHFLKTIGPRPLGRSVDRINNDGHYSCGSCSQCLKNNWPMNVRWATPKEQSVNTCRTLRTTTG